MSHLPRLFTAQFLALLLIPLATSPGSSSARLPDFAGTLSGRPMGTSDPSSEAVYLPLKATDVRLTVSGGLVEGEVSQVFTNDTGTALEAVYIFPLPSEATVIGMELRVGDRVIRSVVKERDEAREKYEAARAAGQKAALLDQERPNIFTTSVANFNPGETAQIRFTYLQAADYQRGKYGVTFPMVVGPRYIPLGGSVPDARRIAPPLLHPAIDPGHRLSLSATITGIPVQSITSTTHAIRCKLRQDGKTYDVTLEAGAVLPNCDFHLDINVAGGEEPEVSLVTTDTREGTFGLVTLLPPVQRNDPKAAVRIPRDVLFLIDTSGSMNGESIGQAQAGLLRCLDMLQPNDTFTIVRFASDYSAFAPSLEPVMPERVEAARSYVRALQADGGTEMQAALDFTLSIPSERENALRLIVFLTDGDVGNEDSLMRLLNAKLGPTRIFTFGIGSAPNEFLMRRLAELGRGQSRFIRSHEDIGAVMSDFFRTVDQPAMTNVRLDWISTNGEPISTITSYPYPCPDVFIDRPVQIVAKLPTNFDGALGVNGMVSGTPVKYNFALNGATQTTHQGIPTLFGRAVVNDLMCQRLRTTDAGELLALRDKIVQAGLSYQLVTAFTSRVAIEEQITRATDGSLKTVNVPTMLPRGWSASAFFATATDDSVRLLIAILMIISGLFTLVARRLAYQ